MTEEASREMRSGAVSQDGVRPRIEFDARSREPWRLLYNGGELSSFRYLSQMDPRTLSRQYSLPEVDLRQEIFRAELLPSSVTAALKPPEITPPSQTFSLQRGTLTIHLEQDRIPVHSSVDILADRVYQAAHLPAEIETPAKRESDRPTVEAVEYPAILYNCNGKRGYSPIDLDTGCARIEGFDIRFRRPMPLSSGISMRTVRAYLEGAEIRDAAAVYEETVQHLRRHVELSNDYYYVVSALYGIGTHFHMAYDTFGYLQAYGVSETGKSTLAEAVAGIGFHPVSSPDLSDPSFFRIRQGSHPTLFFDEKRIRRKNQESILEDLLNNGFRKGGCVYRNVKDETGNFQPVPYEVYGPLTYASTSDLPSALRSRALRIVMLKTLVASYSQEGRPAWESPEATRIREQWYLFRLISGARAWEVYQQLRPQTYGIVNRLWELARPLISTAFLIGLPDLVQSIQEFFKEYAQEAVDVHDTDSGKVLRVLANRVRDQTWQDSYQPLKELAADTASTFDEDSKEWKSQRVSKALRMIGLGGSNKTVDGKKAERLVQGYSQILVRRSEVEDRLKRYGLESVESVKLEKSTTKPPLRDFISDMMPVLLKSRDAVPDEEVIQACEERGYPRNDTLRLLSRLVDRGELYRPQPGTLHLLHDGPVRMQDTGGTPEVGPQSQPLSKSKTDERASNSRTDEAQDAYVSGNPRISPTDWNATLQGPSTTFGTCFQCGREDDLRPGPDKYLRCRRCHEQTYGEKS